MRRATLARYLPERWGHLHAVRSAVSLIALLLMNFDHRRRRIRLIASETASLIGGGDEEHEFPT
jgi:hypothetical protein